MYVPILDSTDRIFDSNKDPIQNAQVGGPPDKGPNRWRSEYVLRSLFISAGYARAAQQTDFLFRTCERNGLSGMNLLRGQQQVKQQILWF